MNYSRFYRALNALSFVADKDEYKQSLVSQYTEGRTSSLREMRTAEYNALCEELESIANPTRAYHTERRELRRWRSIVLKLLSEYGIPTHNWTAVNAFCNDNRIAGKPFAKLSQPELEALSIKMRSIIYKGRDDRHRSFI